MKKLLLLCIACIFFTSCKNTWTKSDKDSFYQACMDDATQWAGSPENAKTYCECVMVKIMDKYPHVSDALEHMEDMTRDPDIKACRIPIMK